MLSTQTIAAPWRLFRPWQPDVHAPIERQLSDYIELPAVESYEQLENTSVFPEIQSQFLSDIGQLKELARHFINNEYDVKVDAFHSKLETPPEDLREHLLPLYRETRFHIHQLINQLENQLNATTDEHNYFASLLHNCLNEIDLCPAGVHSRFANSYVDFQWPQAGLDGLLFKIRKDLFHEFIGAFIFQCQREGRLTIVQSMEVHLFNCLHNLYCDALALPPIVDPRASDNIARQLLDQFLASAPLAVNQCTIVRTFSKLWSERLSTVLHEQGIAAWETDAITAGQITAERAQALDTGLFQPINHLLQTTPGQALDLWQVIEESDDGSYRLSRFREKILFWLCSYFHSSNGRVFAVIPNSSGSQCSLFIGSIDDVFFWVFDQDRYCCIGEPCTLQAENHITLTLTHLAAIDFSTWPDQVCFALLTQAMAQTEHAEDIAAFLLHPATNEQLYKTAQPVRQALSQQLSEKYLHGSESFTEKLKMAIVYQLLRLKPQKVTHHILHCLVDTPLLETVLSFLHAVLVDITPVTQTLTAWQVADFSLDSLGKLLTADDCQRVFHQALNLKQAQLLSNLLLTGHCDDLAGAGHDNRLLSNSDHSLVNLLSLFASHGILPGLKYLLELCQGNNIGRICNFNWEFLNGAAEFGQTDCLATLLAIDGVNVNHKAGFGWTPLIEAARHGHYECIRLLLATKDIQINAANDDGWTALIFAAKYGHTQCVEILLSDDRILVNCKTVDGWTALNCAADSGHTDCIKALINADNIQVNLPNPYGSSPLLSAVRCGSAKSLKVLLTAPDIDVNLANNKGRTPLHAAAQLDKADCVEALLAIEGIKLNEKDHDGWTPIDFAAIFGKVQCIRLLLATSGILINEKNSNGFSPLHAATAMGHIECVKELLFAPGIDINLTFDYGWTALHGAAESGRAGCLRALLKAPDIMVNKKCDRGWTALYYAVANDHADCVEALLDAPGIDINLTFDHGCTALHSAAESGRAGCLKALLKSPDIMVNKKCDRGWTALHYAVTNDHADCVEALLGAEATKVNKRSSCNLKTPLMLAINHESVACARLLIGHARTNINKVSPSLNTALTRARAIELTDIVNLLEADPRLCRPVDRALKFLKRQ